MRAYTRIKIAGATYFFTVNLAKRHGNHLLTQHIDTLRTAFRAIKQAHPFVIEAAVVLPDHLHCVWRLPPDDMDFAVRWRLIKAHFSRMLAQGEYIGRILHFIIMWRVLVIRRIGLHHRKCAILH